MRARSRPLSSTSRLRARMRKLHPAIDPSNPDFQAFGLGRYSAYQRREIVKMIARHSVISGSDIADALVRAKRKARLGKLLTGAITGFLFVTMFILGALVAPHGTPPGARGGPTASASAATYVEASDEHRSPWGEADRELFADLQTGRINAETPPDANPVSAAPPLPTPVRAAAAPSAKLAARRSALAPDETVIQLGAFADAGAAKARWQVLVIHFPSLQPLTQWVAPVTHGGRTLYRLRASGVDAARTCSALTGASMTCFVATDAR